MRVDTEEIQTEFSGAYSQVNEKRVTQTCHVDFSNIQVKLTSSKSGLLCTGHPYIASSW